MSASFKRLAVTRTKFAMALMLVAGLGASAAQAQQCLTSNQTGTNNGFYYSFWKDSGNVTFCLQSRRPLHIPVEQHQQLGRRQRAGRPAAGGRSVTRAHSARTAMRT